jgi:hypothetical protein
VLADLPAVAYEPAPWYLREMQGWPLWIVMSVATFAALGWLLKKPLENFVSGLFDLLTERIKRSSKEPASSADLLRKARKAIILEQVAERLRLEIRCDHVSVYGCQNGEYLRSGEGIDKFVMQAEASRPGDPRYMDTERIVFASDIPRTIMALEAQPYLLLWAARCDDWKVNKMMSERNYSSSIAVFLRRPLATDAKTLGVIGMYVLSWRETEVYRPDQAGTLPRSHNGPTRLIDADLEQQLLGYAQELSYTM